MGRTDMLNKEVNAACDIAGSSRNDSAKTLLAKTMRHLPTLGRSATLWMAVAMLAMTWMSETQASPVQVAQATTSDTGALQQSPEQEQPGAETLSCELTVARRDIELLQHLGQEHDRAERLEQDLAAARHDVENPAAPAAKAGEETARAKQAARGRRAGVPTTKQPQSERAARRRREPAR